MISNRSKGYLSYTFAEKTCAVCNLDSSRLLYYRLKSGFPVNISCWVVRTEKIDVTGNTVYLLFLGNVFANFPAITLFQN